MTVAAALRDSAVYAVTATRQVSEPGGWIGSRGLPTFYLYGDVQGIAGPEHAAQIARAVVGEGAHVHVERL